MRSTSGSWRRPLSTQVYSKSLLVRSKNATNVFVTDAFGKYDYLGIGAQK